MLKQLGVFERRGNYRLELCECECGRRAMVRVNSAGVPRSSRCRSCGPRKGAARPSGVALRTFQAWQRLVGRADLCERWRDAQAFADDMGAKPKETRIEKIDPLKSLEPGNCRWVKFRESGHDGRGSGEYASWSMMWTRVRNPNRDRADYYVGRGIKVCETWREFSAFLADMGPKPSSRHSLDRIDPDGNYEPGNCRWATDIEQANNRTRQHLLTARGKTKTVAEWAREVGVNYGLIEQRVRSLGWDAERAIFTPSQRPPKSA